MPDLPGTVLAEIGIGLATREALRATRRIRALFDHPVGALTAYLNGPSPASRRRTG